MNASRLTGIFAALTLAATGCATAPSDRVAVAIESSPQPNVSLVTTTRVTSEGHHGKYTQWRCVEHESGDELICHASCDAPSTDLNCARTRPTRL